VINLLEILPAGIGLFEVRGFRESKSESIILLRIIPIVLADTAATKIRRKICTLNSLREIRYPANIMGKTKSV
jgi:hypothetical protein